MVTGLMMCCRYLMAGSKMSVQLAVVVVLSVLLTGATHAGLDLDPYKILKVTRGASQAEIKKVYKRLAKEWYIFLLFWSVFLELIQIFTNELLFLKASGQKQKSWC